MVDDGRSRLRGRELSLRLRSDNKAESTVGLVPDMGRSDFSRTFQSVIFPSMRSNIRLKSDLPAVFLQGSSLSLQDCVTNRSQWQSVPAAERSQRQSVRASLARHRARPRDESKPMAICAGPRTKPTAICAGSRTKPMAICSGPERSQWQFVRAAERSQRQSVRVPERSQWQSVRAPETKPVAVCSGPRTKPTAICAGHAGVDAWEGARSRRLLRLLDETQAC